MALAKLPPVDYQPWKPDPRTERAQARKKFGLSQPIPPSLLLQPYVPAPIAPGLPSLGQGLPGITPPPLGLQQPQMPGLGMPPPGAGAPGGMPLGRVPGMAEGGEFDVNPDEPYWDDMTEEERQQRLAEIAQAHAAPAPAPAAPPPGGLAPSVWQGMIQGAQNTMQTTQDWANAFKQQADERRQQVESQLGRGLGAGAVDAVTSSAPAQFLGDQAGTALDKVVNAPLPIAPRYGVTPSLSDLVSQPIPYAPEARAAAQQGAETFEKGYLAPYEYGARPLAEQAGVSLPSSDPFAKVVGQGASTVVPQTTGEAGATLLGSAVIPAMFGGKAALDTTGRFIAAGAIGSQTGPMAQSGAEALGAPEDVQRAAGIAGGFAPYTIGLAPNGTNFMKGAVEATGAGAAGAGSEKLGIPDVPVFGNVPALATAALLEHGMTGIQARANALAEARAPGERPGLFGGGALPGLRTEPVNQSLSRESVFGPNEVTATGGGRAVAAETLAPEKRWLGAPAEITSQGAHDALVDRLVNVAGEGVGAPHRFWYENGSDTLMNIAQGDVPQAEKMARLTALSSTDSSVKAQGGQILKGWAEYQAGEPIAGAHRYGAVNTKIDEALNMPDEAWNSRVVNMIKGGNESAQKLGNFYLDILDGIDPQRASSLREQAGASATFDRWMNRAFGYANDSRSPQQYAYMSRTIQEVADRLGWTPKQVQASIWVDSIAQTGKPLDLAGGTYTDSLGAHQTKLRDEILPTPGNPRYDAIAGPLAAAEPRQLAEQALRTHKAFLDDEGNDVLARLLRSPVGGQNETPLISPARGGEKVGLVNALEAQRVNDYAVARAAAHQQADATWIRPFDAVTSPGLHNAVELGLGRAATEAEVAQLKQALPDLHVMATDAGAWVWREPGEADYVARRLAAGAESKPLGVRQLPDLAEANQQMQAWIQAATNQIWQNEPVQGRTFAADGRTANVADELGRSRAFQRPDVREAIDQARQRIDAADRLFLLEQRSGRVGGGADTGVSGGQTFAATPGATPGITTTTGPTQITPTGAGETVGPGGAARFEPVTPEAEARARAENLTERNLAEKQARQEARRDLKLPGETLGQAAERLKTAGAPPPAQASPGLENITLADLVGALQQRAQGASEGPIPAQGPYTPAETARAAQGEIRALQEAWTKYNGMPDGELIRQAEAAGVKPVGMAPLEGGRIPQAYRDQLTEKLTLDERTKATADLRPTEATIGEQMRAGTAAGAEAQTNRMDRLFGPAAQVDPRYNPELARHEAQVEEMAARDQITKAAAEEKVSQQDWMKQRAEATPDAPHARGSGMVGDRGSGNVLGALGRTLNEVGYFVLGGDVGTVMRQDIGNLINPFKAVETGKVAAATFRSFFSEKTAQSLMQQYGELERTKALGVKVDFADWKPQADMQGRESGISKLTSWIPGVTNFNRANAMWLNSRRALTTESALVHNPKITPAQAQTMANMYRAFTGKGDFGGANTAMSKVGPLFTSLRFMASIPQRFAYLVPWQRMSDGKMEFMGPVWREAASAHAGWASGTLLTMGMAYGAGLQVGMDPRKMSSDDEGPGFGRVRTGRTDHDLTGGAGRYLGMVVQLASGQKNWGLPGAKDYPRIFGETSPDLTAKMGQTVLGATPGRFGGTIADYLRNSMGPGANIALEVAKLTKLADKAETSGKVLDFFHPDYWDKGPLGTGSLADRALGHVAFLWMQGVADSLREDGLKGASVTAPLEIFGSSSTTIPPGAKSLRTDVLEDDARRAQALGSSRLGELTKGERYEDMSSYEKGRINAARDPAEVERMAQEARAQGSVYQIKADADAAIEKQRRDHYDEMARDIKNGKGDASAMRQYMSALDKQTFEAKKSVTIEGGNGLPAPSSDIQKAVAAYQALYTSAADANGKIDHDRLEAAQKSFIDSVKRANPELGERLQLNVAQKVNTSDHPLAQEYDKMAMKGGPVDTYYSKVGPGNDYDPANAWRASHPQDDAKLAYYGFTHDVRSIEGYREFKKLTEGGSREPNLTLDMGKQGTAQRNAVPYAAREPLVEKYFSLPTAAEKAVWQQQNPNADAALWQWGYTSQLHSMRAYELTH